MPTAPEDGSQITRPAAGETPVRLRKSLGQRGSYSLDFTAGQLPFASLAMTGLVPAVDPREVVAAVGADFSDWVEPLEVNNENSLFTLDGFGAVTRSLRIDTGLNVNLRSLIGARYVKSGNRNAPNRTKIYCRHSARWHSLPSHPI